jgi:hypothetical protein
LLLSQFRWPLARLPLGVVVGAEVALVEGVAAAVTVEEAVVAVTAEVAAVGTPADLAVAAAGAAILAVLAVVATVELSGGKATAVSAPVTRRNRR